MWGQLALVLGLLLGLFSHKIEKWESHKAPQIAVCLSGRQAGEAYGSATATGAWNLKAYA